MIKKKYPGTLYWLRYNNKAHFSQTLSMFALTDMKMTATCLLLPDVFGDDPSLFVSVNEKVCSRSVITDFTFYIFMFESRMVVYLGLCFVIFTNMLIYNKFIYYNIMVKFRHRVLLRYFTCHVIFFFRCKCPHLC